MPSPIRAPTRPATAAPPAALASTDASSPPAMTGPTAGSTPAAMPKAHSAPTPAPAAAPVAAPSATFDPVTSLAAVASSVPRPITPTWSSRKPARRSSLTARWAAARSVNTPTTVLRVVVPVVPGFVIAIVRPSLGYRWGNSRRLILFRNRRAAPSVRAAAGVLLGVIVLHAPGEQRLELG